MNILLPITFLAGTGIVSAIEEALELSIRLRIGVVFPFNGTRVAVWPHQTVEVILIRYKLDLKLLRQEKVNG